jgi:hypothetical protein
MFMSLIVHSTQTDFGVICLTQIESFNATMSKQPGLIPVLVLERIFAGTTTIEIISVQTVWKFADTRFSDIYRIDEVLA